MTALFFLQRMIQTSKRHPPPPQKKKRKKRHPDQMLGTAQRVFYLFVSTSESACNGFIYKPAEITLLSLAHTLTMVLSPAGFGCHFDHCWTSSYYGSRGPAPPTHTPSVIVSSNEKLVARSYFGYDGGRPCTESPRAQ